MTNHLCRAQIIDTPRVKSAELCEANLGASGRCGGGEYSQLISASGIDLAQPNTAKSISSAQGSDEARRHQPIFFDVPL